MTDRDQIPVHDHADDPALARDLAMMERQLLGRRKALGLFAGAGTFALLSGWGAGSRIANAATTGSMCIADPIETEGPFPADGTNASPGPTSNALVTRGVVRSDIRTSFVGSSTARAAGVPVTITLTVVDARASCAPLAGHAVYIWQCDAEGRYSLYNLPNESYLRGVQVTDREGRVTFTTIFPGYYPGRYPHIHFEIFPSLASATSGRNSALIGQLAMPSQACAAVFATSAYGNSAASFARTSIAADGIFRDNTPAQIAQQTLAMSGSPAAGYTATGVIGLAARILADDACRATIAASLTV